MKNIIFFDDNEVRKQLLPLTHTRPISKIRVGISTIEEKWINLLGEAQYSHQTATYLKKQYPSDYINPLAAFKKVDQTTDFPAMAKLLHEVKLYRGDGIAAGLFYEAKVAEAVSLVVEEQKKLLTRKEKQLTDQDIAQLENVIAYLNDHYAFDVPLERLAKIACMGTTKLKSSFKQLQGCTITEYVQQRRMSQAEHLLIDTDFTMGQIAEMIGYSTSSRFAELFRKSTGILPIDYRKMAHKQ